jgi:hypothetical protein
MILSLRIGISVFLGWSFYLCFTVTTNGQTGILQVVGRIFVFGAFCSDFRHRCIEGHAAPRAVVGSYRLMGFAISIVFTCRRSEPCTALWTANEINGTGIQDKHANPGSENPSRRVAALAFVDANRQPRNEYRKSESPYSTVDVIANGDGAAQ